MSSNTNSDPSALSEQISSTLTEESSVDHNQTDGGVDNAAFCSHEQTNIAIKQDPESQELCSVSHSKWTRYVS